MVPIDYRGTAGFVPAENTPLIMTNANVVVDVNYRESSNKIYLHFNANYTIYNPNETQYLTLGAPFSSDFKNIEDNCIIKINGSSIPFSITEQDTWEAPWDQYIDFYYFGEFNRKFIVIDISITANETLNIGYTFDSHIANPNFRQVIEIYYDVGTSRAWNGSITEKVQFKVVGRQPTSFKENCTITNIEMGKNYVWEWKNETINVNGVYISYSNIWIMGLTRFFPFIIFGSLIAFCTIVIALNKRKQRKRNIPSY